MVVQIVVTCNRDYGSEDGHLGVEDNDDVVHSCTRFPCYLGMEIYAETQ